MIEFTWINLSSLLTLVLQFAAVTGEYSLVIFVRDGDDVTLPCKNVINDQNKCDATTWEFSDARNTVELIILGQIGEYAKSSVSENCSLVIKKVTDEDVGLYICRQYKSGRQQGQPASVNLILTDMTEHKHDDQVTFTCSVLMLEQCRFSVKWMSEGKSGDKDMETSQPTCSDAFTFPTSELKPNFYELLKCKVRDIYTGKEQLFSFRRQSSEGWVYAIVAAAGFAALIITVVVIIRMRITKGNKTETKKNTVRSSNTVVILPGPEIGPDLIDPVDDVSYAAISFARKTSSSAQKQEKDDDDDDEGDRVTYSTLKTSDSTVALSTDPSNLYASVNKAHK